MKQVRLLSVSFDTTIPAYETPAFRGAVIEKVGLEKDLFHNHNNDPDEKADYHYRYPLIQYKRNRSRPTIVFIEEGLENASYFFSQPNWELTFAGKTRQLSVDTMTVRPYQFGIDGVEHHYSIRNWIALNGDNYQKYKEMDSMIERIQLLENILKGNILAFASGVKYRIPEQIEITICEMHHEKMIRVNKNNMLTFNIDFKTNTKIPPFVGLGRCSSLGFGVTRINRHVTQKS